MSRLSLLSLCALSQRVFFSECFKLLVEVLICPIQELFLILMRIKASLLQPQHIQSNIGTMV